MKIRTQLIISMVFFGVALAIISTSVVSTNQQVERLNKQEEIAKNIELKAGELSYLSNDYLLYHESQQIDRWESKYASFSDDVSNLTVSGPDQQVLVSNIKANGQRLKDIFGDAVSKVENTPEVSRNIADPGVIQVSWSRMGVQTQGIVFDASRLSQMLREQADRMKQQNDLLIFALIGAFIAFLLTDYLLIYRRTLKSIFNLQDGTRIIGSGNLDHSIIEKKGDEIGELAHAFNLMTANLKTVTASKTDLEREIVERKLVEEALLGKEADLRDAQRVAHVGSWYWDAKTDATTGSDELLRIYGLDPTTQSMPAFREQDGRLYPRESWQQVNAAVQRTLQTGVGYELDVEAIRDGARIWITTRSEVVKDADGRIVGLRGTVQDITERKRMEEELRNARDGLERRVQERTAELSGAKEELEVINEELQVEISEHEKTEKDLMAAKEAAEAATKTKAEFLANMSHEIRTPMNAVIGMTSLLIDNENLTPEQKDFIETIRSSGDALMTIINDILDFSKMESDKAMLEEQPFDLRACVEESLGLVAVKAAEKDLNLAYTIDKNIPGTIIGDPSRLRQILGNLLSNAVKFTDAGEVKVSVSSNKDDTHELRFAVQDTGIGIPQDRMDRLFQSFSQVEPSTTRLYGGTGLGLAISKKLVEMMGGRIWVESEPGKGSTFHFTIRAEAVPGETKTNLAGVQPQLVGKRVLIVDDNKTNRRILGLQTYSWGMMPMTAALGREALEWIRRGDDFDIAILDMGMQEMDGLALAREIRKYNKALPMVMLTSLSERIASDLFTASLTKPIRPSKLHEVLVNALSSLPVKESAQVSAVKKDAQINSLRILLAEDNVSSQKVAINILERLGYKTDSVANGIEALQALERQPYDVVLMDVRMPEMDGLEATRIIRQRWPDNGPKVIAVTAYALEGDREKCLAAGMDDYISKPVQIEELAKVLSKYQR